MKERMRKLKVWKISDFIKANFTRLLFLAVLLTACFSLKTAALGKYAEYLEDYSSVTAGDLYFTSNVLGQAGDVKNEINTFLGDKYSAEFELRAYENALYYNRAGKDVYYYIQLEAYTDNNYKTLETLPEKIPNVTFDYGTTDSVSNTVGTYKDPETGNTYPVGCLKGRDDFQRLMLQNTIRVESVWVKAQSSAFLKVTARSITKDTVDNVTFTDTENAEALKEEYKKQTGIYDVLLDGKYTLKKNSGAAGSDVNGSLLTNNSDYSVEFTINCAEDNGARIVFDPEKLSYEEPAQVKTGIYNGETVSYILASVQGMQSKTYNFYKAKLGLTISYDSEKQSGDIYILQGTSELPKASE